MGYLNVLKAVLFKNFKTRTHHWIITIFQIVLPIVLFGIVALIANKADCFEKKYINHTTFGTQLSSEQLYYSKFNHETKIYFTPSTPFALELMYQVQLKFSLTSNSIKWYNSENEMINDIDYDAGSIIAVIFKNLTANEVPKTLDYSIRPYEKFVDWRIETLYNSVDSYIPDSGSETYVNKGLLAFQLALETSYVEMVSNESLSVTIVMEEFPYPPHIENVELKNMIKYFLPIITVLSFTLLGPIIISHVMEDKVSGMKELLRVMGLKPCMLWFTWYLDAFCWNFISVISITSILSLFKIGTHSPLLEYCSFSVLLLFLSMYSSVFVTFCFALSSLFNKPIHSSATAMITWIITFAIALQWIDGDVFIQKIVLIFPNASLLFGFKIISEFETREIGVQWSTLFQSASEKSDEITMGGILISFTIQAIFYVIITLYVNEIRPGIYGKRRVWYFPLQWLRNSKKRPECTPKTTAFDDYIEKADLDISVKMCNVSKFFGDNKAVDNLSIDFYNNQITVLLGKNGAGKTTTLSMIAGMLQPTTGTILIYDSLKNENSVSICPQNNLHFHALSVLHHLRFYGILKGLCADDALCEAEVIIIKINLWDKKDCLPLELSGGMQRRLSLAMAIIGTTRVVILDEPTTGLDPQSRREIWDVLISLRGYRTFIVTTHSMEEAEVLGDRIAIIDQGVLKSYGTQLFLRKKLGAGSYLSLHLKNSSDKELLMSEIAQDHNLKFNIKNVDDKEVQFFLSNMPNHKIKNVLEHFEQVQSVYNIENITLTKTTMEEIFLRASTLGIKYQKPSSPAPVFKKGSKVNVWRQFCILFLKWVRFAQVKLHILLILTMLLCVLICLRNSGGCNEGMVNNDNALKFDVQVYDKSVVFIGNNQNGIFPKIADYYGDLVKNSVKYFERVQNVSDKIIQHGIQNIEFYKKHLIAAANFDRIHGKYVASALYSNTATHGAPISLNVLSNALVKATVGKDYAIVGENRPLPSPSNHRIEHTSMIRVLLVWYIFLPLNSLLLVGISLFNPHSEYSSKIMHLQQMCGVSKWVYWLSCFLKDVIVYAASIVVVLGVVYTFNSLLKISIIFGDDEIVALLVILVAFGVSAIPYSYLFTYKSTVLTGYGLFIATSLLISDAMFIGTFYLEFSDDPRHAQMVKILNGVFLLFPTYGLKYTTMQLIRQSVWNHNWNIKSFEHKQAVCAASYNPCCDGDNSTGCNLYQSYFNGADPITVNIIQILFSSLLYFMILYMIETQIFVRSFKKLKRNKSMECEAESGEKEPLTASTNGLHVNIESKKFGSQVVLDQINFEIAPKECVGLLGVNGAGKSTIFRLLAGEEYLEDGDISLEGNTKRLSIRKNKLEYSQNLGYCPQFDELSNLASGKTLLRLFADLRGVRDAEEDVNTFLEVFGLKKHANRFCSTYSIGCKRKLFTAFALIGTPSFIILDEPTAGVDVESRRKLWDTLTMTRNSDASIILSTHNMDECELLCKRILTLKQGKMIFNGSINDLKSKYKESYTTTLKLKPTKSNVETESNQLTDLKTALQKDFSENKLLDEHCTLLKYIVEKGEKRLSDIFQIVEEIQNKHTIVEDFDISDVTLESLFLNVNEEYVADHTAENRKKFAPTLIHNNEKRKRTISL